MSLIQNGKRSCLTQKWKPVSQSGNSWGYTDVLYSCLLRSSRSWQLWFKISWDDCNMRVRRIEQIVLTLNQIQQNSMIWRWLLYQTYRRDCCCLEQRIVCTWYYPSVAVNKKRLYTRFRGLLELRSCIIIVSFGSNLHFATFIRYTHFEI